MWSLTKLRRVISHENEGATRDVPQPTTPSPSPPKQKHSPKVKPMLAVDTNFSDIFAVPTPSPGGSYSPTSVRPAALALDLPAPPSPTSGHETTSPPTSPRLRRLSGHQNEMQGMSVVSFRLKQLVSREKRRFEEDGFNLDLTYVTNRIIAFGYPAESFEGIYRNHYKDVFHFFEKRHPNRYQIYNLCSERSYDKEKFHSRVMEFPFDDHCPPPIDLFDPFCRSIDAWLADDPANVAAIHCKAGKGRTGVMICAYLLHSGVWRTAYGAMEFFAAARSLKVEGVTIPSQRRFIMYFEEMCHGARRTAQENEQAQLELAMSQDEYKKIWSDAIEGKGLVYERRMSRPNPIVPAPRYLALVGFRISGVYSSKRIDPRVRVECGMYGRSVVGYDLTTFTTTDESPNSVRPKRPSVLVEGSAIAAANASVSDVNTTQPLVEQEFDCDRHIVAGEVRVSLKNRNGTKIGHFWFHTSFISNNELRLTKVEIDKVLKDIKKGHKLYSPFFGVTLIFDSARPKEIETLDAQLTAVAVAGPDGTPMSASRNTLKTWATARENSDDSSSVSTPKRGLGGFMSRPRAKSDRNANEMQQISVGGKATAASGDAQPDETNEPRGSDLNRSKSKSLPRFFSPRKKDQVNVAPRGHQ
ncbi:TPA: hypothetical protein N0F65_006761 [Lagenidium giganteum]|uniref:Phosphatidylinositol-3,4,5-trisphosphate 3-phosphatase n=1 Tax=Lagenidium giganteum TaxID=4803 RepID=A0AAV2Z1V9_9STRA|nr:TPA: hypothetical protein N0F65_006761 [Lagenidium giganteum]